MLDPKNYIGQEFECTQTMAAWWGTILKEGERYVVSDFGIRDTWIYTDHESYWKEFPVIPKYDKSRSEMTEEEIRKEEEESKVRAKIFKELKDKYEMKVRATYIVIDGEIGNTKPQKETFYLESIEDIIKEHNLDSSKKVEFHGTHNIFREWFNDKPLHREVRLKKLLE